MRDGEGWLILWPLKCYVRSKGAVIRNVILFFSLTGIVFGQVPQNYQPLSGAERFKWFANSTVGPTSLLAAGPVSSAWGTLMNSPEEYGPHWEGFGKRYGMRLTGVATSNAMEAGLGSFWGEDPRYFRAEGKQLKGRVGHIVKSTFLAYDSQGNARPAYARYLAVPGSNFLSNTWRMDSEAQASDALMRTMTGFLGRMAGNAFIEFWPDVKQRVFKKKP